MTASQAALRALEAVEREAPSFRGDTEWGGGVYS
jgi:hypothetical protein